MFAASENCIFLDIETNVPPDKEFADKGQLAIQEIKCAVLVVPPPEGEEAEDYKFGVATCEEDFWTLMEEFKGWPVVGHNIFRFDAPILKRIWGFDLLANREVYDTLIMSKISEIKRPSHSLESYSEELGIPKPPLGDDLREIIYRCKADTRLTKYLYEKLLHSKEVMKIPDNPYKVEFRVAEIIARQHARGLHFDKHKANDLFKLISADMEFIRLSLQDDLPPASIPESKLDYPPKKQFNKDGQPSALIQKYVAKYGGSVLKRNPGEGYFAMLPFGRVRDLPMVEPIETKAPLDIDSPNAVKQYLLDRGWRPTIWNRKKNSDGKWENTTPKLWDDNKELCPNIVKTGIKGIEKISEYLTLRNRLNVINGWLDNSRVKEDSIICSDADTLGAVTGRFTHKIVANVPRSTSTYGKEIRALFKPRFGYCMVGWDASSLEARMEAHYTYLFDGGTYGQELLEGDIHTKNKEVLSLPTRDAAKTWKYAVTYGASPKKLASTFGWSVAEAEKAYKQFWDANPALRSLVAKVQSSSEGRGWVRALDGRPIPVDSKHSALNRLLQSAGAITMKYAMVIADREVRLRGLEANGLIRYHDEEQWECPEDSANTLGNIGVNSIRKAGRYLKLNVPLDGEYKIGSNWSETH